MGESPVPGRGADPASPLLEVEPTPAFEPMALRNAATPPPPPQGLEGEVAGGGRPPVAPVSVGGDEAAAAFR